MLSLQGAFPEVHKWTKPEDYSDLVQSTSMAMQRCPALSKELGLREFLLYL